MYNYAVLPQLLIVDKNTLKSNVVELELQNGHFPTYFNGFVHSIGTLDAIYTLNVGTHPEASDVGNFTNFFSTPALHDTQYVYIGNPEFLNMVTKNITKVYFQMLSDSELDADTKFIVGIGTDTAYDYWS
jgi:hypothetical protein